MTRIARITRLPPIRTGDRARRGLWRLVWAVLYRPTPVAAHRWRSMLLRVFGAEVAPVAYPYPSARIWAPWNLDMRHGSCLAGDVDCYNVARITLGEGVTVSQRSYLCTASHDFDDPDFPLIGAPIIIGAGAWVAAEAFVGPGVMIAEGAVVLARAVVVGDVELRTVVGGNPARILRTRAEKK
jgi:putative colanic acid biosynthesis acetyltransferase WcaF